MGEHAWALKAQTPIWTGNTDRQNSRLITTGLLGSIRWWFEVVARGLGGTACDPSPKGAPCQDARRHCVELFGCTGWARKFRFQVLDDDGRTITSAIAKDTVFHLRLTPLRPVAAEEWALLDLTLKLIADYGAIGGKTVLKPSDEQDRASEQHHRDYGLIKINVPAQLRPISRSRLETYVNDSRWRRVEQDGFDWADLRHFWFVAKRHLTRTSSTESSFNRVVGREQNKACSACGRVHNPPQKCPQTEKHPRRHSDRNPSSAAGEWLAGKQQESKKVFSFKDHPARTFGFVKPGTIDCDEMKERLKEAWHDPRNDKVLTGSVIIDCLFRNRAPAGK